MAFDACFLGAVLDEIREKAIGGRIEKIHQPARDSILVQLRCDSGRYKLLFGIAFLALFLSCLVLHWSRQINMLLVII